MLVKSKDRPVGISHEEERRFEIEIEPRLKTSRRIGDVGEDSSREGIAIEIDNLRVIDCKASIGITSEDAVIIILTDCQLSSRSTELPATVISDCVEYIHEIHRHLRTRVNEGLVSRKVAYRQLLGDLVHVVRLLICTDKSDYTPVVNCEDS